MAVSPEQMGKCEIEPSFSRLPCRIPFLFHKTVYFPYALIIISREGLSYSAFPILYPQKMLSWLGHLSSFSEDIWLIQTLVWRGGLVNFHLISIVIRQGLETEVFRDVLLLSCRLCKISQPSSIEAICALFLSSNTYSLCPKRLWFANYLFELCKYLIKHE